VKTFTEAHGGTVTVQSEQDVGSTFRIVLPTKANASGRTDRPG
jgi:signal transduction histidine kinase